MSCLILFLDGSCLLLVIGRMLLPGAAAETIRLPTLNVDRASVIAVGFDHSADFAHQLHIAFSSTYTGACIFAGQPWNCAGNTDPEHCKRKPDGVDVGSLVDDPRRRCGQNPINKIECVDPVEYVFHQRIFVFRGKNDDVYLPGSVENTVALLAQMQSDPAQTIQAVLDEPFGHVLPLKRTPHTNSSKPAGFDGPRECLQFAFNALMTAGEVSTSNWIIFDQTEFIELGVGFQAEGWMYVPKECWNFQARCRLVVRPDTCSPPTTMAPDAAAFASYADANGIVLLHPCVGGYVDEHRFPHAVDVKRGKLDVHGELTRDYVEQSAPHMRALGKMVRRILGSQEPPNNPSAFPVRQLQQEHLVNPPLPQHAESTLPVEMPVLSIDRSSILTAGCSNTADFAHQFHVAFSSVVTGSCVFSGQPYRCAVTRFDDDYMVPKTPSTAAGIHCPDCDSNGTLIYDHCKNHPEWVDVNVLAAYAETAANVDDPRVHLAHARAFVFGPTHDRCYQPPAMANVAAFYWKYASRSTQVKLVDDQPFPHTLPTNSTPYFNTSQPAGYDGPGRCLQHVFFHKQVMQAAAPRMDGAKYWRRINATAFVPPASVAAGMRPSAWLFVPPQCDKGTCKLVILPGGCDAFKDDLPGGPDDDFARYGLSNGIVILKPCQGGPIDTKRFPYNHENRRGMVDVYGQLEADYATQTGSQMRPIGGMLKHLMGVDALRQLV